MDSSRRPKAMRSEEEIRACADCSRIRLIPLGAIRIYQCVVTKDIIKDGTIANFCTEFRLNDKGEKLKDGEKDD